MKKIAYLLLFIGAVVSTSCSGDDNNTANTTPTADYLPLTTGNYWVYTTATTGAQGAADSNGRDSLYVANDTVIGTNTYKKFKTLSAPTGFYSGSLSGNAVRVSGGKLLVTGSTTVSISEDIPFSIAITDFPFFDANATTGQQIGSTSGSFQQTIQGLPLTFTYTLKTTAGPEIESTTANSTSYTNIKTVITTLNLKISLDAFGITLLPQQDVVVSTQYFAEGIGAIKTSTDISYTLADLSLLNITLPIPQSGTAHQDEILVQHHVQ